MQPEGGYSPRLWLATFHCGMEYEKKTIPQGVPHHFSPHFFTPSLPYPYPLPLTFTVLPPHTPLPHRYSLSLSLSLPHPLTPTPSHSHTLSLPCPLTASRVMARGESARGGGCSGAQPQPGGDGTAPRCCRF